MTKFSWTQAICAKCWNKRFPERPAEDCDIGFMERCCCCGKATEAGIYFRVDPKTVPYPSREKD